MFPPRAPFFPSARLACGEDFTRGNLPVPPFPLPKRRLPRVLMKKRIVVAGAGAAGASVAYHLAELGADDVVLCDRGVVAGGATSKAMGGVRQQFSTEAEVRLAQASIRFFEELGAPFFEQVGYLFLATTTAGLEELERRAELQRSLGVPVVTTEPPAGVRSDDVVGAVVCREDGVADPPAVAQELVRRAAGRGVEVREQTDAAELEADIVVIT